MRAQSTRFSIRAVKRGVDVFLRRLIRCRRSPALLASYRCSTACPVHFFARRAGTCLADARYMRCTRYARYTPGAGECIRPWRVRRASGRACREQPSRPGAGPSSRISATCANPSLFQQPGEGLWTRGPRIRTDDPGAMIKCTRLHRLRVGLRLCGSRHRAAGGRPVDRHRMADVREPGLPNASPRRCAQRSHSMTATSMRSPSYLPMESTMPASAVRRPPAPSRMKHRFTRAGWRAASRDQ